MSLAGLKLKLKRAFIGAVCSRDEQVEGARFAMMRDGWKEVGVWLPSQKEMRVGASDDGYDDYRVHNDPELAARFGKPRIFMTMLSPEKVTGLGVKDAKDLAYVPPARAEKGQYINIAPMINLGYLINEESKEIRRRLKSNDFDPRGAAWAVSNKFGPMNFIKKLVLRPQMD